MTPLQRRSCFPASLEKFNHRQSSRAATAHARATTTPRPMPTQPTYHPPRCLGQGCCPWGGPQGPHAATAVAHPPHSTTTAIASYVAVRGLEPQWRVPPPSQRPGRSPHAPWGVGRPLGHCSGAGDRQTVPCQFRLSAGCSVDHKYKIKSPLSPNHNYFRSQRAVIISPPRHWWAR